MVIYRQQESGANFNTACCNRLAKHKGAAAAGETANKLQGGCPMSAKEELIRYIQSLPPEQLAKIARRSNEIIEAVKEAKS